MIDQIEVFNRRDVAEIVGIDPAVVRNWSSGKPIAIGPSVDAPKQRGAPSLYSRTDVYLFALAKHLSSEGFELTAIGNVLSRLKRDWFDESERGSLVLAKLSSDKPVIEYISRKLNQKEESNLFGNILSRNRTHSFYVTHIDSILERIDRQIRVVKGHRANEKKNE
jgi:hypothetical protein